MKSFVTLFFVLIGLLTSCSTDTTGDEAVVEEAGVVSEIPEVADLHTIDTATSVVTWIGTKPTGQHHGTIKIKSGSLAVIEDSIVGGDLVFDLNKIDAIDLKDDPENYHRLVNHLKSDDFFDVSRHPEASFRIISVEDIDTLSGPNSPKSTAAQYEPKGEYEHRVNNPTHLIKGNLTLRGTTLSITFPAAISTSAEEISAEAKFNIDRTRWGLMYKNEGDIRDKAKDSFIYNTVNTGFVLKTHKSPAL